MITGINDTRQQGERNVAKRDRAEKKMTGGEQECRQQRENSETGNKGENRDLTDTGENMDLNARSRTLMQTTGGDLGQRE